MQMDIKFELKPKQRPKLAEEIGAALHTIPRYQKAPSLAYKIGDCTLERDGTLRIPDSVDKETVTTLLGHLTEQGFTGNRNRRKIGWLSTSQGIHSRRQLLKTLPNWLKTRAG